MDDLVVYSKNFEEHLAHLTEVFTRLVKVGLTLNRQKAHLAQCEINFLGHSLSGEGLTGVPKRIAAIKEFPRNDGVLYPIREQIFAYL
jgi:hypothetical protein